MPSCAHCGRKLGDGTLSHAPGCPALALEASRSNRVENGEFTRRGPIIRDLPYGTCSCGHPVDQHLDDGSCAWGSCACDSYSDHPNARGPNAREGCSHQCQVCMSDDVEHHFCDDCLYEDDIQHIRIELPNGPSFRFRVPEGWDPDVSAHGLTDAGNTILSVEREKGDEY